MVRKNDADRLFVHPNEQGCAASNKTWDETFSRCSLRAGGGAMIVNALRLDLPSSAAS